MNKLKTLQRSQGLSRAFKPLGDWAGGKFGQCSQNRRFFFAPGSLGCRGRGGDVQIGQPLASQELLAGQPSLGEASGKGTGS